jgi:hypothetical protein
MEGKLANVDRLIAELASRAHGLVTRGQLLAAGVSSGQIEVRLAFGALIAVYRGVYRVGHAAPNVEAHYLAAVLACGEGALLAGVPAAHLRGARSRRVAAARGRHHDGAAPREHRHPSAS